MKFIHTSDLHLNSKMNSKLARDKSKDRKKELLLNFLSMTEYAKKSGAEAFIIAGDLFDSEKVGDAVKSAVTDIISSCPEIKFLYLPGNHEKAALLSFERLPENLLVFGSEWTYFNVGDACFAGRSETAPGMFNELTSPSEKALIAVLHAEMRESSDFGGIIGKKEFQNTEISYLALGHYHSYQVIANSKCGAAVYSGTALGRGFDEVGEKGFVVAETNGKNVSFCFQKSTGRKLDEVSVQLDGVENPKEFEEKILHACRDISKNDLVRVVLRGYKSPDATFDIATIEAKLKESFYYFEIKDESKLEISPEDYAKDKSLKGEFIRLVLSDKKLSDEEKDKIILTGIRALMGDGFDS